MITAEPQALQERFAPGNHCFGCGPANERGLRIRSFPATEDPAKLLCDWTPGMHHEAFDGIVNGGIVGALLDCHANWTASWYLRNEDGLERPPCTVTARYEVHMRRPTPSDGPLRLEAWPVSRSGPKVEVEGRIVAGGKETVTFNGTFVAVQPGHPAYHRW